MALVRSDLTPDKVITAGAIENAARVLLALGGSTNGVIHLAAIAGRVGLSLDLARLNEAERAFYRDVLGLEVWTWRSSDLFFRDQGRLNYLAAKLRIPVLPLAPDLICRAGASATEVRVAEVARGACAYHIVHWMGAMSPSPSFFCRGPLFRLYACLWSFVGSRTGRCCTALGRP